VVIKINIWFNLVTSPSTMDAISRRVTRSMTKYLFSIALFYFPSSCLGLLFLVELLTLTLG